MRKSNLISVIIPVYNQEKYIAEAIESILNQSHKEHDIIVVDDGSEDNSAQIAKSYPEVRYFHQKNQGSSTAINLGLSKVKGDYITFLDSDDYWTPIKSEKQLKVLEKDETIEGVFGYHKRFYEKDNALLTEGERADSERTLPAYFKASSLFRKESFFKVGLFDVSILMGDFIDWYARAKDLGLKMDIIDDVVMHRRIHDKNTSNINKSRINEYVQVIKASLDRRRKEESGS